MTDPRPAPPVPATPPAAERFNVPGVLRMLEAEAAAAFTGERTKIELVARLIRQQQEEIERLRCDWRPIESAPEGIDALFWIVPKTAEESYCDGYGKPIVGTFKPRLMLGRKGSWSALAKATHWMEAPTAPTETSDAR